MVSVKAGEILATDRSSQKSFLTDDRPFGLKFKSEQNYSSLSLDLSYQQRIASRGELVGLVRMTEAPAIL